MGLLLGQQVHLAYDTDGAWHTASTQDSSTNAHSLAEQSQVPFEVWHSAAPTAMQAAADPSHC